ncbi:chloride channel protein [Singulisphaera sp. PoT]|uniref:chloride channel protein n=1 Tax=Singulisphaera sp. PoT TaxID=3411797 RepID=UPI003BF55A88
MAEPLAPRPLTTRDRLGRYCNRLVTQLSTPGAGRVAICSPIVGVVAGLGATAFFLLLNLFMDHVLGDLLHFHLPPTGEGTPHAITYPSPWWLTILIPTLGGLVSGLIVFSLAPEAEGHGTDALIRSFHRGAGLIRGRIPLIKGITSIVTIGTGGSAGQEGPIAQIGAGFGSVLARFFRLSPSERRILILTGAAGGVGAIFRAPLGGALFGVEVLYSTTAIESAALLPCLSASIIAYSTFALFITPRPIFLVPDFTFKGLLDLPAFALLALACACVGWLYVRIFYGMRDYVFKPIPIPRSLKPALGGLMLGLMALVFPELMTGGYGWVQWGAIGIPPQLNPDGVEHFTGPQMGMLTLFMLAILKIVATGLTISSGGSGGVFGPSVFIGGMLGGAVGQFLKLVFPSSSIDPAAFALVGMGGFFAGVAKAPLTSIVMVCEMTGSYSLLVPLMLVCGLNLGLSRNWTLYEEQVPSPLESPAHQGDFVVDVLERLQVSQVPIRTERLQVVLQETPFSEVINTVAQSTEMLFPVVDRESRLVGIFSLRDVRLALLGSEVGMLVIASDLMTSPAVTVTPRDDLHTALQRLTELNVDQIPVVAENDPTRLIGLLDRREVVGAYSRSIKELKQKNEADNPSHASQETKNVS